MIYCHKYKCYDEARRAAASVFQRASSEAESDANGATRAFPFGAGRIKAAKPSVV